MKKILQRRLGMILTVGLLCSMILSYGLQFRMVQMDTDVSTRWLFWQIQQVLDQNATEMEAVKEDYQVTCLMRAMAASYIIENCPTDISDHKELQHIADLLDVDELHLFDEDGTIVAGSQPKYFGLNLRDGEQMRFFLPMLEDREMSLCQNVTPNTAEGKLMQYAAVWRADGKGIVQIGVEPERVLEVTKKNELSYIFSLMTEVDESDVCAADPETFEILASANREENIGRSLLDLGFQESDLKPTEESFHTRVDGVWSYCMFTELNGVLVVRFCQADSLYTRMGENILIMMLFMLVIFLFMLLWIFSYLDKYVVRGISNVNEKLNKIADGDLKETVDVHTTPEFTQLSGHINYMVKSILDNATKLSFVLNTIQLPVGVYEYSPGATRVRYTSKVPEIMGLTMDEEERLFSNAKLFEAWLNLVKSCPVSGRIFRLPGDEDRYIKIESYASGNSFFGILIDVTADINEKRRIERERDEDMLTGLYNRRAFYAQMNALFAQPERLKKAALLMMDTDGLKQVNDELGHEFGDKFLCGMADLIRSSTAPCQIAARLSGDEFALLLYGCDTEKELEKYLAEMKEKQSGHETTFQGHTLPLFFSMGVTRCPEDGEDYHTLLKRADQRMYEDKRQRKTEQAK